MSKKGNKLQYIIDRLGANSTRGWNGVEYKIWGTPIRENSILKPLLTTRNWKLPVTLSQQEASATDACCAKENRAKMVTAKERI